MTPIKHRCDLWEDISTMGIHLEVYGGRGGWTMIRADDAESYKWPLAWCPFCGCVLRTLEGLKGGGA